MSQLGNIPGPITGPVPTNVTGELDLTQGFGPAGQWNSPDSWLRHCAFEHALLQHCWPGRASGTTHCQLCKDGRRPCTRLLLRSVSVLGSRHYTQKDMGLWSTGQWKCPDMRLYRCAYGYALF